MPPSSMLLPEANDQALSSLPFSLQNSLAVTEKQGWTRAPPSEAGCELQGSSSPSSSLTPTQALRASRAWEMHFNTQFLSVALREASSLASLQKTVYKTEHFGSYHKMQTNIHRNIFTISVYLLWMGMLLSEFIHSCLSFTRWLWRKRKEKYFILFSSGF